MMNVLHIFDVMRWL